MIDDKDQQILTLQANEQAMKDLFMEIKAHCEGDICYNADDIAIINMMAKRGLKSNPGTPLLDKLKELETQIRTLQQSEIKRIRPLNQLASWTMQDVTGPWEKRDIQIWVLNKIKEALGQEPVPVTWQPESVSLQDQLSLLSAIVVEAEKALNESKNRFLSIKEYWNGAPESAVDAIETVIERADNGIILLEPALTLITAYNTQKEGEGDTRQIGWTKEGLPEGIQQEILDALKPKQQARLLRNKK